MRLWLVRHATPDISGGICYGRLDVPALAQPTRDAAQRLATVLPAEEVGLVAVSPARRCRQLAAALARACPQLPDAQPWAELQEADFGTWEGQSWDAVDPAALAAWTDDFEGYRGHGGESVAQVFARVGRALERTRAARGDVLWITHAGVLRALDLLCAGLPRPLAATDWPRTTLPHGSWRCISL